MDGWMEGEGREGGGVDSKDYRFHSVIVIVIDLLTNRSNSNYVILSVIANNMRPQLFKTRHFQHNWPLVPTFVSKDLRIIGIIFMSEHCRLTD